MRTTPRATPPTGQPPRPTRAAPLATSGVLEATTTPSAPTIALATAAPAPSTIPPTLIVVQPQRAPTPTNEQRWRDQQVNRQPLDPARQYSASRGAALLWYDPRTGQTLEIGTLLGEFTATATFTWRARGQPALLVPYQINHDYGLTAISDAIIQRMHDAGYPEQVEAFILTSDAVQPK